MNLIKRSTAIALSIILFFGTILTGSSILPELKVFSSLLFENATAEQATSGVCGPNLTWEFDSNTYTLTISGTGEMFDYDSKYVGSGLDITSAPWNSHYYTIRNIIINKGVTSIGKYAFLACTFRFAGYATVTISIPNSLISIGDYAFEDCSGITSITIPNSVTSLGCDVFRDCTGLTKINIPNRLTSISRRLFVGCTGLNEIIIPKSVTSIGSGAFLGCTGLSEITIPDSVTSIDSWAFAKCTGLKKAILGNTCPYIPSEMFFGCTSLKSVYIPSRTTSIYADAFKDCTSLTDVYYGGKNKEDIEIKDGNDYLIAANWHYNSKKPTSSTTPSSPENPSKPGTETNPETVVETTVDYRSTVHINLSTPSLSLPSDYTIAIYENSKQIAKGNNTSVKYVAKNMTETRNFDVKFFDKDGKNITSYMGVNLSLPLRINVKNGLFDRIIAFFRGLFGSLPEYEWKLEY